MEQSFSIGPFQPRKVVYRYFGNFSGWTEQIHSVLHRNWVAPHDSRFWNSSQENTVLAVCSYDPKWRRLPIKTTEFFSSPLVHGLRRRTRKDSWVRVRTVQNSCFGSLTRSRRRFQFCRHGMPVETNLLQDSFLQLSRVGRSRKCTSCVKVRSDCYDRPNRFNHRCHFKKWSYDRGDYMRTLHRRSLMLVAIGAIAISWSVRVLSGLFKADRGNREWFYENYFLTRRRSKRSKLSHGPSI